MPINFVLSWRIGKCHFQKVKTGLWWKFFIPSSNFSLAQIIFGRKRIRWNEHRSGRPSTLLILDGHFNLNRSNFGWTFAHEKGLCHLNRKTIEKTIVVICLTKSPMSKISLTVWVMKHTLLNTILRLRGFELANRTSNQCWFVFFWHEGNHPQRICSSRKICEPSLYKVLERLRN